MDQEKIRQAADILRTSKNTVVMTGAGIGRPSGIPDFRSESGLWSKDDPMEAASIFTFRSNPQRFFDWLRPLMDMMLAASPNPAHLAITELEQRGIVRAVITQNIDGLHQVAGNQTVYELHGHIRSATCSACSKTSLGEPLVEPIRQGGIPLCESCSSPYKPDITLFGEALPEEAFIHSHLALEACDTMLIVGTSLMVHPAASLPLVALRNGARTIIVNLTETDIDRYAEVVLHEDVAVALPAIVEKI
jgi:NAD-dependent deacetylase